MMQTCDTIIHAAWIVPVIPKGQILEQHSLIIDNGKIINILPTEKAVHQYQSDDSHQLDSHILIPGLVNSHTHSPMNLMRGLADDLPLMTWLEEHIWPAEAKFVNPEFITHGTELAIAEMIKSGTTTFNDMYFFPDITAQVSDKAGIRAVVGQIMIDFPSAWANSANEYLEKGLQLHQQYLDNSRIYTAMAPHAPYTVNDDNLMLCLKQAQQLDVPIHIHVHETQDEINQSLSSYHCRPLERLNNLGLLNEKLIAIHMTQLNENEQSLIIDKNINLVHCPESNMKLASGISPVNQLLKQGVNIALGTDSSASNNDLDMLGEMKSAALLAKISNMDATALDADSVLAMATINGAKALHLDDKIGSLELGKEADICAVNIDNINSAPMYHPVSQLIYSCHREQVSDVWVQGKQLLKQGQLTQMDTTQILEHAKLWQERLQKLK